MVVSIVVWGGGEEVEEEGERANLVINLNNECPYPMSHLTGLEI